MDTPIIIPPVNEALIHEVVKSHSEDAVNLPRRVAGVLAEFAHNVVAHPLLGVALILRGIVAGIEWLHDATGEKM
jgi:hypothetical protein